MSKESLAANSREIAEKESRVRKFLKAEGLNALVLTTQANFCWFTCGGENRIATGSDLGGASAVITPRAKYIICDNIEAPRLEQEEVGAQGFEFKTYNWWESSLADEIKKLGKEHVAADSPIPGTKLVSINPLRYSLTPQEISRYRWLGKQTAWCLSCTCHEIEPGMSEHQIAAVLGYRMIAAGIVPNLILIATDERIEKFRHPIPTDKALERYAMVVAGAKKWGLVLSATRIVHFGPISAELRRKHEAVMHVDAEFIARTRPGTSVDFIFRKGMDAYAHAGFPDEWQQHHQGGATGYAGRDYRAKQDSKEVVQPNQAFAWNPSISGTKSEDTIIALPDETEIISAYGDWPMKPIEVESMIVPRPDILER